MRNHAIFTIFCVSVLLLSFSCFAEELTLTTYYPAPYGVYNQMVTRTLGVGDNNGDGLITSSDAPDPASAAGQLWVAGNVTIGGDTAAGKTNRLLKIAGDSAATGIQLYADNYFDDNTWGTRMWKDHHSGGIGLQIDTQYAGTWYESVYVGHGQIAADPRFGVFGGATIGSGYTQVYAPPADGLIVQGNVGIGTTAPQSYSKLEVNTTGNNSIYTMDTTNGGLLIGYQGPNIQGRTTSHGNSNLILNPWGGNVGIGTAGPTTTLDVDGQVRIRGGSPEAGKVLTSDANGLGSWQSSGAQAPGASVFYTYPGPCPGAWSDMGSYYPGGSSANSWAHTTCVRTDGKACQVYYSTRAWCSPGWTDGGSYYPGGCDWNSVRHNVCYKCY